MTDETEDREPGTDSELDAAPTEHAATETQPTILALPDQSPYSTLNVDFLKRDDAAGIARVAGPGIGAQAGQGRLLGQVIVRFSELLDRLMERTAPANSKWSPMQLRPILFVKSVDLPFAAGEEALEIGADGGVESPAIRAARMLTELLSAQDEDQLIERLRGLGDPVASAYEALMALISAEDLLVDWQDQPTRRPERVSGASASQVIVALDREVPEPTEPRWFTGTLTRADSDANEFKIRLSEVWEHKRVIPGHYNKQLEPKLESLWNRPVRAMVEIHRRRRAREQVATLTYEMVDVAPAGPVATDPE